jgi:two-component system invasion response regulator UvrY
MNVMEPTKIVLADDHVLLRNGLVGLVTNLGFEVMFECNNGREFIDRLDPQNLPDIVLMDINMPLMDGYETTLWLKKNYPLVHVLALTMYDDENSVIRMLRSGAKGYILKDADPRELRMAINSIMSKGFYHSEMVTGKLLHSIHQLDEAESDTRQVLHLNDREIQFLKLVSTEMTYKEIAHEMHLSPRTIDGYRDALFEKLELKSRTGLVLFAIKNGIVQVH